MSESDYDGRNYTEELGRDQLRSIKRASGWRQTGVVR